MLMTGYRGLLNPIISIKNIKNHKPPFTIMPVYPRIKSFAELAVIYHEYGMQIKYPSLASHVNVSILMDMLASL